MTTRPDLYLPTSQTPLPSDSAMADDDPDRTIPGKFIAQVMPTGGDLPEDIDRSSPDAWPTIGHVGRYALKSCVGEGGLGTVYAAHDPLLGRWLAIKTLHVSLPDQDREQFNAIFLNEAKAAGGLSHPHIVTVFDVVAGDGDTYIAMELLRGKDLRHLLASDWRPCAADAALIMRRVADALSYAHHRGVIHRDIKPANIFMVGRTHPKVLDFGIARIRQVEATANDGVSRFGDLVGGSPYYMAPEQVRQDNVDRRADVYAMGVVLYELLTGKKPFTGQDLDVILASVLTQPVVPPHELDPRVPKPLSDIVMRAMARDVTARTRSARLLSQELRVWLDPQLPAPSVDASSVKTAIKKGGHQAEVSRWVGGAGAGDASKRRWAMGLGAMGAGLALAWGAWTMVVAPSPHTVDDTSPVAQAVAPVVRPPVSAVAEVAPVIPPDSASAVVSLSAVVPAKVTPTLAAVAPVVSVVPATKLPTAPTAQAFVKPIAPPAAVRSTGTLRLAISPWGRVFVDGRSVGVAPPLTQLTLPVGKHVVAVHNDESPAHTQTIEVLAGQMVHLTHAF